MDRRTFVQGLSAVGTAWIADCYGAAGAAPTRTAASLHRRFDALLRSVTAKKRLLAATRKELEGVTEPAINKLLASRVERPAPSATPISKRASDLIVTFEVSSQRDYTRGYQRPTWPEGASGATIGIGYDVGYVTRAWLQEDWQGLLPDDMIEVLLPACGVKGQAAHSITPSLRSVVVPWSVAQQEYLKWTQPRTVAETETTLANTKLLTPDSLGALVSLVYNRGASFYDTSPRCKEMYAIRQHMEAKEFQKIPAEFRSMKRLWVGTSVAGLVHRRELEALLFEAGLRSASTS
jgi:GH24 family phage-related lysozyme (muramidase)